MKLILIVVTGLAVAQAFSAGSGIVAAPAQDRPGMPTEARVTVQNRLDQAVPVRIVRVEGDQPEPVTIAAMPAVRVVASSSLPTTTFRQAWEYRSVRIAAGQDAAAALAALGEDGWEATGIQLPAEKGTAILLKRPR